MKIIKIAYLDISSFFAGAEMSLYSLVNHLPKNEATPLLVFPYPQAYQKRYNDLQCKTLYLASEKRWWMGSEKWEKPLRGTDVLKRIIFGIKLAFILKREHIDILHLNLLHPKSFWWIWCAKRIGIKIVAHYRSDSQQYIPTIKIQKLCDAIICVSNFVKEKAYSRYSLSKAYTVYDPIDFEKHERKMTKDQALEWLQFDPNVRLLTSVGQLARGKGHHMALRAFSKISAKFPNSRLLIAGGGNPDELKYLKDLANELNIAERTIFTETQISYIDTVYDASDLIFSLTLEGEAFGRIPFEALSHQVPTLAPTKGAALELITDNGTGFLVDPYDADAIAKKAIDILTNSHETNKIIENGLKLFKPKFSPETSAGSILTIYKSLLSRNMES
jgi:glycosyltransferase involved in cell wall biosynthesis